MKKTLATLISLISLLNVNSGWAYQPSLLEKDKPAPFTGYLFSPEDTAKLRGELVEKDGLVKINESYQRSIDLYQKNEEILNNKVNVLLNQNDQLSNSLYKEKTLSSFEKVLWFVGGVLITGFAFYGAQKVTK